MQIGFDDRNDDLWKIYVSSEKKMLIIVMDRLWRFALPWNRVRSIQIYAKQHFNWIDKWNEQINW